MNQLRFECTKIFKSKSNYFGLILLLILLIPPIFTLSDNESTDDFRIYNLESNIGFKEQALDNMEDKPEAQKAYDEVKILLELEQELLAAYKNEDTRRITELTKNLDSSKMQQSNSGSLNSGIPQDFYLKNIATNEYLLENDIERVDPLHNQVPTVNFIYMMFIDIIPISILYMIIGLTFSNIYTLEKRNSNIDFLNTVPKSLFFTAGAKILSATAIVYASVIAVLLITIVINSIQYGIGSLNYPLAYSPNGINVYIMEMSTFILRGMTLFTLFILFLSLLSFTISLITGSLIVNGIILLVIILLSNSGILTEVSLLENIAHILPITYADSFNIVRYGDTFAPLPNESTTFESGVITLTVTIIVLTSISYMIINTKKKL